MHIYKCMTTSKTAGAPVFLTDVLYVNLDSFNGSFWPQVVFDLTIQNEIGALPEAL